MTVWTAPEASAATWTGAATPNCRWVALTPAKDAGGYIDFALLVTDLNETSKWCVANDTIASISSDLLETP